MISCINCGHRFIVNDVPAAAPVVPEASNSSQNDWQDQPPPIRSQRPEQREGEAGTPAYPAEPLTPGGSAGASPSRLPTVEEGGEPDVSDFSGLSSAHPESSLEDTAAYRPRDRSRVKFAVIAVLFSVISLACLGAGVHTRLLPWIFGSAASAYVGAHMSIFSTGPMRIIGALLNIAVLVGCIGSLILLTRGPH
jgi:hypothetical protein